MFGLPESASCELAGQSIDGPGYVTTSVADVSTDEAAPDNEHSHDDHDDAHDNDHGSDHDDDHDGHHDNDHGHDEPQHSQDEHSDHGDHSEINVTYEWICGDQSQLNDMELLFTEHFASVETIEIQILSANGAQVMTREGRAASIPLLSP